MNRKARRAAAKQAGFPLSPAAVDGSFHAAKADDIYAAAISHYRKGEFVQAENLCRLALNREPRHLRSLVLLGDVVQQGGRNKLAVKLLSQALELDRTDAAAHDNIAIAYQALGRMDEAVAHFTDAMALGLRDPEILVKQSAAVTAPLKRLADAWPRQVRLAELLGAQGAVAMARDAMVLALLQSKVVHDLELERLLTAIRRGLLQHAIEADRQPVDDDGLAFFCALGQQCFLNEYVFALGDTEQTQIRQVEDRIVAALGAGAEIAPLDLIVAASYLPLHSLPGASSLLGRAWPDAIERLLIQQIREPLEEEADRKNIAVLTPIDDAVSLQVQHQYEESPYPRWAAVPQIEPTTVVHFLHDRLNIVPISWPQTTVDVDILIAGCGTGSHSIDSALRFPKARILAIDISRTSLAYARRKSRDLGLTNIEYGQADILKLASLDRRFDVIETVGVLHHLADPAAGWRVLLSLLRPLGLMLVGLYSATARQSLAPARALITERGYRATADDIRACRQDLIRRSGMPPFRDFSSTSGCRDLLFNVMEHQFTIPQIEAFLDANGLTFLGFEQLPPDVLRQFQQQFPDIGVMRDLGSWHAFERMNPLTFGNMYFFWVQKTDAN
ncbi:MAG TPA: methyltransferase domain-containing protein [Xanthobacteraceae bacterium]|nr:methyltransferase domain-containing protein [Xanthobacteraceae bacterium]